jgi:hypothetical protein
LFLGDAHRESGVFSLCFALSPVESCSPPKLVELTSQMYAADSQNASEETVKCAAYAEGCGNRKLSLITRYLLDEERFAKLVAGDK